MKQSMGKWRSKVDEAWQKEINGNVECDHGFGNA